ncbi:FAD-dependent oxidoreductase [Streptomyces sp. MAR4 CNX-425]|uniref:FAD-dependent oxidoreductase n=1 Tax=Streptomyces sp. MAR4 CNX-425 TaxID=3406343 RepID=UPI003B503759
MIQGDVVLPGDNAYEFSKQGILQEFDSVHPQGIVYCETPQDVSTAIRFARDNGIATRTRSGGHNLAGWSTSEGMVLDVGRIDHVSPRFGTIRMGPGAQAIDVLTALSPLDQQVITGTCATVCAGGFLSGGGIGLQTRKFGIGSDRVVSAGLVLSDGRYVRACESRHPDLYWAIRGGGGNNFGVVVDFEVRPISAPTMVYFDTTWPYDKVQDLLTTWQEWTYTGSDALGSVLTVFLPDGAEGTVPIVRIMGGYLGPASEVDGALDELAAQAGVAPTTRTVTEGTYAESMKAIYGCAELTVQECHRTGTNPDAKLPRQAYMRELTRLLDRPTGAIAAADLLTAFEADRRPGQARNLYIQALGGVANQVPRTETGYVHRNAEFFVAMATLLNDPTPTEEEAHAAEVWPNRGFGVVDPVSTGETYLNFPNPERSDWRQAYYAENYPRLLDVKKRYDAPDFFRHPQSIGS